MNPEQNDEPKQVDQLPQPDFTNQPSTAPSPEPTVIQPVPATQPVDTAVSQPLIQTNTQPIQTPQPMTQPAPAIDSNQKSKKPLVIAGIALVTIILLVGGAFAYNKIGSVHVIDPGFESTDSFPSLDNPKSNPQSSDATESEQTAENTQKNTNTTTAPDTSLALMRERDTERKNELKMAQQQLENYFNDNGEYPADWTVVVINPDGRSGPNGDAYTYVASADLQSYTLSANLENDADPKADADGNYVVLSINQW